MSAWFYIPDQISKKCLTLPPSILHQVSISLGLYRKDSILCFPGTSQPKRNLGLARMAQKRDFDLAERWLGFVCFDDPQEMQSSGIISGNDCPVVPRRDTR